MTANTNPIFELTLTLAGVEFTIADTVVPKTIQTGGANGSRIDDIYICSNDTAEVDLAFYINDTSVDHYIGNVVIPAGSGYTTVARISAIATLAPNLGYITLPNGYILKANCVATMTVAKTCTVVAVGGDF